MRLFKRGKIWWVEISRGVARSLRTSDKAEAEAIVREMKIEDLNGRVSDLKGLKRVTISEFADEYLAGRPDRSIFTQRADRKSLGLLQAALGDVPLVQVNSDSIDRFVAWCRARGVEPVSINHYLRHIRAALRRAKQKQYILEAPEIKMQKYDHKMFAILQPADIAKLLAAAKEKKGYEFFALLSFLLYTGARRSEALACSVVLDGSDPHILLTKTKGRRDRTVPLLPELAEILRPLAGKGALFGTMHPDTVSHWFRKIAKDVGLDVHLHDLRHNAATYMIRSGMHLAAVQEILGHSDVKTTRVYTHVLDDFKRAELSKLKY